MSVISQSIKRDILSSTSLTWNTFVCPLIAYTTNEGDKKQTSQVPTNPSVWTREIKLPGVVLKKLHKKYDLSNPVNMCFDPAEGTGVIYIDPFTVSFERVLTLVYLILKDNIK